MEAEGELHSVGGRPHNIDCPRAGHESGSWHWTVDIWVLSVTRHGPTMLEPTRASDRPKPVTSPPRA